MTAAEKGDGTATTMCDHVLSGHQCELDAGHGDEHLAMLGIGRDVPLSWHDVHSDERAAPIE